MAAAVRSAVVPGLAEWRSSRSERSKRATESRPASLRTPPSASTLIASARHVGRALAAGAPRDVRVGRRREQRQERLDDRVVPAQPVGPCLPQRRHAGVERDRERGVVLVRDAVAIGGQPHDVEQRLRRLARHVLIRRPAQPAGFASRMAA